MTYLKPKSRLVRNKGISTRIYSVSICMSGFGDRCNTLMNALPLLISFGFLSNKELAIMKDAETYRYRWVVLLSASFVCSLTWGLAYTIGLFYVSWVNEFNAGSGEVAAIGGINTGISCIFGPIYDAIHRRLGYRRAGALGGILVAIGNIGSSLATNLYVLGFFYGGVQGFGFGLAYFGASLAVNEYFFRQRTLAEGMVTFGSGAGGFGFTMLSQYLIVSYGWRGALLILGGIALNVVLLFQLAFTPDQLHWLKLDWESTASVKDRRKATLENDQCDTNGDKSMVSDEYTESTDQENRIWIRRCINLFKNPLFLLMLCADLLCWTGIYVPYVHLPKRASLLGIEPTSIAWIASSMSLSMSVGRLVIPGICSMLQIDPFYAYGFVNGVAGLLTALCPLLKTEIGLYCYAISYGFFNAAVPLIRASVASLLGPGAFSMAYGWIISINGVGLFVGPALAGLLYDITQTYDVSFYTSGAALITCGLLVLLRNKVKGTEKAFKLSEEAAGS